MLQTFDLRVKQITVVVVGYLSLTMLSVRHITHLTVMTAPLIILVKYACPFGGKMH